MKVEGKKVFLREDEISECPLNPRWAGRLIAMYGADTELKGRLGKFSRCPEVLAVAGYEVEIITEEEERKRKKKGSSLGETEKD